MPGKPASVLLRYLLAATIPIAFITSLGCQQSRTSVIVDVWTDLAGGSEITEVRIVAAPGPTDGGDGELSYPFTPGADPGQDRQPFEVAFVAGGDQGRQFVVEARGALGERRIVTQTARISFVPARPQRLKLFLSRACRDFTGVCAADQTCDLGRCVPQTEVGLRDPLGDKAQKETPPEGWTSPWDAGGERTDVGTMPPGDATADTTPDATGDAKPDATADVKSDAAGDATDTGSTPVGDSGVDAADGSDARGEPAPCHDGGPIAENCFNGQDDDCDGFTDCADSDCQPIAMCVPAAPIGDEVGVALTDSAPCPTGYLSAEDIHGGLGADDQCSGCRCTNPVTTCQLTSFSYYDAAKCSAGDTVTEPVPRPYKTYGIGSAHGGVGNCYPAQAGGTFGETGFPETLATTASCRPGGTPVPPSPSWSETVRFCPISVAGVGCGSGLCVPRAAMAAACVLTASSSSCPIGYDGVPGTTWYHGWQDSRTCSGCACGASGGDCSGVALAQAITCGQVWEDFHPVALGYRDCGGEFSYRLQGEPASPICSVMEPTAAGPLQETAGSRLCCQPSPSCVGTGSCALPPGGACVRDDDCATGRCATQYADADGDGYGAPDRWRRICADFEAPAPQGWAARGDDCCDGDPNAHPGQSAYFVDADVCGSRDYNCDGVISKQYPDDVATCTTACVNGCMRGCSVDGDISGWALQPADCGQSAFWNDCGSIVMEGTNTCGGSLCTSADDHVACFVRNTDTRFQGCR